MTGFGNDLGLEREGGRQLLGDDLRLPARGRDEGDRPRPLGVGIEDGDLLSGGERGGFGLDPVALGQLGGNAARRRRRPEVPPVDVADVGRVIERLPVGGIADELGLALAGRQVERDGVGRPGDEDGVVMGPVVPLLAEDEAVARPR